MSLSTNNKFTALVVVALACISSFPGAFAAGASEDETTLNMARLMANRYSSSAKEEVDENETGDHRRSLIERTSLDLYSNEQMEEENHRLLSEMVSETTSTYVVYNGRKYMTLDQANPTDATIGCQRSPIPLPEGFQIAPNTPETVSVIKLFGFGTHCLSVSDGASYGTKNFYPGHFCWYNVDLHGMEYNAQGYVPRGCSRRILIVSKTSALPACSYDVCMARSSQQCQVVKKKGPQCTCQRLGGKRSGVAVVRDPLSIGFHNREYRTLDGTTASTTESGCQEGALSIPKPFRIASTWGDWDAREAAILFPWGTDCLVVDDGPFGFQGWESRLHSGGKNYTLCTETNMVSGGIKSTLNVNTCNRRVLLMRDDLGFKCLPA